MGQLLVSARDPLRTYLIGYTTEKRSPIGPSYPADFSCRRKKEMNSIQSRSSAGSLRVATFQAITSAIKGWARSVLWVEAALAKYNASLPVFGPRPCSTSRRRPCLASDFLAPPGSAGLQNLIAINGVREALRPTMSVPASISSTPAGTLRWT